MSEEVLFAEAGGVARITLDRPAKINAMTASMMDRVAALVEQSTHALLVIEGRGPKGFCAGADVAEFASGAEALDRQLVALSRLMLAMERSTVPIAVIAHGRTLGGGAAIAALADVVIASDDIAFGYPEIHIGLFPAVVTAVLRRRLPEAQAHALTLGGRVLGAADAQALGLVTEVLPCADFAARAEERIAFWSERAPAMASARAFRPDGAAALERDLAAARGHLMRNFAAPATQAVLRRFLDKRH